MASFILSQDFCKIEQSYRPHNNTSGKSTQHLWGFRERFSENLGLGRAGLGWFNHGHIWNFLDVNVVSLQMDFKIPEPFFRFFDSTNMSYIVKLKTKQNSDLISEMWNKIFLILCINALGGNEMYSNNTLDSNLLINRWCSIKNSHKSEPSLVRSVHKNLPKK